MTLRRKLILAQAPLGAALAIVGVVSALITFSLGRQSRLIMADNYRSVLAAQRMNEAVERINRHTLDMLTGRPADSVAAIAGARDAFEAELQVEENNITEPAEAAVAKRLRAAWADYLARVRAYQAGLDQQALDRSYLGSLAPALAAVRNATDEILAINQDAMVHKSSRAQGGAERLEQVVIVSVLLAGLAGLLASAYLTARLLRPLGLVHSAVRSFGAGDLHARARVGGHDEISRLAAEFNRMADHLERYRVSSLGELLTAQQSAQAAIDGLPDPVVILGAAGGVEGVNWAATSALKIDGERNPAEPYAAVDPVIRVLLDRLRAQVVLEKGPYVPKGFEDAVRLAGDEGERILLPRATPIHARAGTVTGVAIVFQDITRVFRFDEMRNNLVATVAHEFRTPLTSLRMALHLCTDGIVGPLTEKQSELLIAARDDCERLQGIVDDLLNLARLESGHFDLLRRRMAVEPLVHLALDGHRSAADQRNIALRAEILPGTPDVFGDPDRLPLVFSNLLANAVRYSPANSAIVVRAQRGEPGSPNPAANDLVRFEIADQGPGIAVEHQASLFQKFYRVPGSPEGGSGLGLFISRSIVQAQGGQMGVDSRPGGGATFWFTVPVSPSTPPG